MCPSDDVSRWEIASRPAAAEQGQPLAPDQQRFLELISGAWSTQALYVAASLGIAEELVHEPRSAADLARTTGANESALSRLLAALAAIDVLEMREQDRFGLGPLGAPLLADHPASLRRWALWWGRSLWPAWGNLVHSVETGQSGRALVTGTHGFDHLAHDHEEAAIFYGAAVELTRMSLPGILAAGKFQRFGVVADIGGGYGELLVGILRASPQCSGILFDLPPAIAGARGHLEHAGVLNRCRLIEGDFLLEVPKGADAYVLKAILHDWDDGTALRILASCRRAMDPRARLVLIEQVVTAAATPEARQTVAISDLMMLVAHGAGERSLVQLERLLVDAGFAVDRVSAAGETLHVIEALPVS